MSPTVREKEVGWFSKMVWMKYLPKRSAGTNINRGLAEDFLFECHAGAQGFTEKKPVYL